MANLEGTQDLLWYRMKYMEYPDEWNEQAGIRDISSEADLSYNQDGVAPDAVTVPQGLITEFERIHGIGETGGYDSGIGGGGDDFDSGLGGGSDEPALWNGDAGVGGGADWDEPTNPRRYGDFMQPPPDIIVPRRRRRIGVR